MSCCQHILLSINLIILGAPHCFIRMRHSDSHPDVVFIEMFPHLIVLNIPMSCCCFSCCQQILLSINLSILGVFFFLISSLSSRCFSTRESAISAAAHSHLGGDLTSWLAPSIGGKCQFCWESSGSRKESGRSPPSLVGTVHRLEMLMASGKLVVAKKTVH